MPCHAMPAALHHRLNVGHVFVQSQADTVGSSSTQLTCKRHYTAARYYTAGVQGQHTRTPIRHHRARCSRARATRTCAAMCTQRHVHTSTVGTKCYARAWQPACRISCRCKVKRTQHDQAMCCWAVHAADQAVCCENSACCGQEQGQHDAKAGQASQQHAVQAMAQRSTRPQISTVITQ